MHHSILRLVILFLLMSSCWICGRAVAKILIAIPLLAVSYKYHNCFKLDNFFLMNQIVSNLYCLVFFYFNDLRSNHCLFVFVYSTFCSIPNTILFSLLSHQQVHLLQVDQHKMLVYNPKHACMRGLYSRPVCWVGWFVCHI